MKIKENVGKMPRKLKVVTKWMILTSSDQNKSSEFSLTPDPSAGAFLWWWSDDVFLFVFAVAFTSRGDLLRDVDQKLYFKFPRVSFPSFSGIPHALISSPSLSEFSLTSCLTSCTNRLLFAGSGGSVAFVTILELRFDLEPSSQKIEQTCQPWVGGETRNKGYNKVDVSLSGQFFERGSSSTLTLLLQFNLEVGVQLVKELD